MKEDITIFGHSFEIENVPFEAIKPMKPKPITDLECCCCGQETRGRQWWNRDTGYGLCSKCADIIGKKEDAEEMKSCYGQSGVHYNVKE